MERFSKNLTGRARGLLRKTRMTSPARRNRRLSNIAIVERSPGEIWAYVNPFQCPIIREAGENRRDYLVHGQNPERNISAIVVHEGLMYELPKNWLVW